MTIADRMKSHELAVWLVVEAGCRGVSVRELCSQLAVENLAPLPDEEDSP